MICKELTLIPGILLITACGSGLPDPQSIPEGIHKSQTMSLLMRNPKNDASAFYYAGGVGYHMTGGGLRMPIGFRGDEPWKVHDFESLKPFAPVLYSQIHPLLIDVEGPLTQSHYMGDIPISEERKSYYEVRSLYVTKFNQRMESLAKGQSEHVMDVNRP